jgi:hypothetical protein
MSRSDTKSTKATADELAEAQQFDALGRQRQELPPAQRVDYTFDHNLRDVKQVIESAGPNVLIYSPAVQEGLRIVEAALARFARHPNIDQHVLMTQPEMLQVADALDVLRNCPGCGEAVGEIFNFYEARIACVTGTSLDELIEDDLAPDLHVAAAKARAPETGSSK